MLRKLKDAHEHVWFQTPLVLRGRTNVLRDHMLWGSHGHPHFVLPFPMCTQTQNLSPVTMSPYRCLGPKACYGHGVDRTCKCYLLHQFLPKPTSFQGHQGLGDCRINWEVTRQQSSFVPFQGRHMATILLCSEEQI